MHLPRACRPGPGGITTPAPEACWGNATKTPGGFRKETTRGAPTRCPSKRSCTLLALRAVPHAFCISGLRVPCNASGPYGLREERHVRMRLFRSRPFHLFCPTACRPHEASAPSALGLDSPASQTHFNRGSTHTARFPHPTFSHRRTDHDFIARTIQRLLQGHSRDDRGGAVAHAQ